MTATRFARVVADTLAGIPPPFRERLAGVAVLIEDRPSHEELRLAGVRQGSLFGLFRGAALTESSVADPPALPPAVVLYRGELCAAFGDDAELEAEIRKTLLHELGHYFGLSERDLARLGYR